MYFTTTMYPWNWAEGPSRSTFSPRSSSTSSQEADSLEGEPSGVFRDPSKRGRPRAEKISSLILEGALSSNSIRCRICSRVFPREKSLQAHMRTHTGERPYVCDYPGCVKSFCQSGQLKTHQRLHTGEKPFACSIEGCPSRFTHANRHCTEHPYASLRRISTQEQLRDRLQTLKFSPNQSVTDWITKHCMQRESSSLAPIQPEKRLKRESALPPATPVVQVHHIDVAPLAESSDVPMPLLTTLTPRSPPSTPLSTSSFSSNSSFNSSANSSLASSSVNSTSPSSTSSMSPTTLPSIQSTLSPLSASCNFSTSAMTPERSSISSSTSLSSGLPSTLSPTRALSSSISVNPSKTLSKPVNGPRPFKKEATDKWVSALALLELAQGVS